MMLKMWESADKIVRKDVINPGFFLWKPTECASCGVLIENIQVVNTSADDLKEKFNSTILDGTNEKTLVIGEANCEIDCHIERAIQMMNIHEKSVVTLNISLENNDKPLIIKFEVTLTKMEPYEPIWEWTPEEKYRIALKYKEFGVVLFQQSRWVDAFHKFSKACKILITLEPIYDLKLDKRLEGDINNLRLVLYNNMAGCQLNRKNYEYTISLCTKILNKETDNVKALYRRGVAYGSLRNVENAVADLKMAVTLEPNNCAVKEKLLIYNTKVQEANEKFEDMVKKMFKV
ncbi:PREDICTED: peptidyl-prolyl cis-trans isomerase FKBP62 [Dufourea novaeangliae]|uniref:Peptidyl-prolyl cis-trans isomerase FKBP4 n=1 Tax=Dufourea novaeangliae TaxID=178035 RepID=A0A154P472_DUFNO|nr:PREDICTED: peptidyl-prolyl cis-trans isomerase FKBP62 [Dufourea novaeangliae]KZC06647.1 Peptidyl-prolyl cis-trans isomerase FKBP4 [Dufourea novaeangliae]